MSAADLILNSGKIASRGYDNDWNEDLIEKYYNVLEEIAVGELGYNIYPNQIDIVNATGMLEAYSTIGLPIMYDHWKFGKRYIDLERQYNSGNMGLAYEMIINSNPCISYLMEQNTLTMQILVMAHACFGHNHVFKNNYFFRQWTMADFIMEYTRFAKRYIRECEEKYGLEAVENLLDAAHSIEAYCVNKYITPKKTKKEVDAAKKKKIRWEEEQFNPLVMKDKKAAENNDDEFKVEPTENLLLFLEENAPLLKDWEREILKIVRNIGQYFYPQRFLPVLNEGFACLSHYHLLHTLYDRRLVDESLIFEFLRSHSGVIFQPDFDDLRYYNGINPYALGWKMFMDMKRICEEPTKEDEEWFPFLAGQPFWKCAFEAVENFKDDSFILQYLSPKLIRDFKFFHLHDKGNFSSYFDVSNIHNEEGYRSIRANLAQNFDPLNRIPEISVQDVNYKTDMGLTLGHKVRKGNVLNQSIGIKVLKHIKSIWRYPVEMKEIA